jgi:hypothetical protein
VIVAVPGSAARPAVARKQKQERARVFCSVLPHKGKDDLIPDESSNNTHRMFPPFTTQWLSLRACLKMVGRIVPMSRFRRFHPQAGSAGTPRPTERAVFKQALRVLLIGLVPFADAQTQEVLITVQADQSGASSTPTTTTRDAPWPTPGVGVSCRPWATVCR